MAWSVELTRTARKDLRAVRDKRLHAALLAALVKLQDDPFAGDVRKLAGYGDLWRVRVSDWRIVYDIEDDRLVVLVVAIGGRGSVYERLGRRER